MKINGGQIITIWWCQNYAKMVIFVKKYEKIMKPENRYLLLFRQNKSILLVFNNSINISNEINAFTY